MKYKLIIFDLDGTLLNSLPDILSVLNLTLKKFSLPEIGYEQARGYIGNGARELVRLAIGDENEHRLDEILSYYTKAYAESDNSVAKLYDGEEAALKKLKSAGIKIAVLTNKPQPAAMNNAARFFKGFGIDLVQGQEEGVPLKPDPRAALSIAEKFGAKASECLIVGDGETDVMTAKRAGMDCISVLWGYRKKEQLEAAGARVFASNFVELSEIILTKN